MVCDASQALNRSIKARLPLLIHEDGESYESLKKHFKSIEMEFKEMKKDGYEGRDVIFHLQADLKALFAFLGLLGFSSEHHCFRCLVSNKDDQDPALAKTKREYNYTQQDLQTPKGNLKEMYRVKNIGRMPISDVFEIDNVHPDITLHGSMRVFERIVRILQAAAIRHDVLEAKIDEMVKINLEKKRKTPQKQQSEFEFVDDDDDDLEKISESELDLTKYKNNQHKFARWFVDHRIDMQQLQRRFSSSVDEDQLNAMNWESLSMIGKHVTRFVENYEDFLKTMKFLDVHEEGMVRTFVKLHRYNSLFTIPKEAHRDYVQTVEEFAQNFLEKYSSPDKTFPYFHIYTYEALQELKNLGSIGCMSCQPVESYGAKIKRLKRLLLFNRSEKNHYIKQLFHQLNLYFETQ